MGVAALPFVLHRWDMYRWDRDHRQHHAPKGTNHSERLTVLLPVWNEATVIEKKLDNLAAQNQAMHLLVVDSASTDSTLELLNGWVSRHPSTFTSVEVLRMEQRQGKTAAVVKALQHLGQHADGLICMTDADAMLERCFELQAHDIDSAMLNGCVKVVVVEVVDGVLVVIVVIVVIAVVVADSCRVRHAPCLTSLGVTRVHERGKQCPLSAHSNQGDLLSGFLNPLAQAHAY